MLWEKVMNLEEYYRAESLEYKQKLRNNDNGECMKSGKNTKCQEEKNGWYCQVYESRVA